MTGNSPLNLALKILGRNIRDARLQKKLSQEQLADLANVHRTYIGMIERGEKNITVTTLLKILKALEVPVKEIIEGM